jgi:predicted secreted hydrolase
MRTLLLALLAAGLLVGGGLLWLSRDAAPPLPEATLTVTEALGGADGGSEGYARATAPRPFRFPGDHGPHPDFRAEWWYWTGNLRAADGRHFAYQLTLFRSALAPEPAAGGAAGGAGGADGGTGRTSAWASRQVYLGHLAVSDVGGGRFHAHERLTRGALGLAGAQASPFRVWLEDWSAQSEGFPFAPLRLTAAAGDVALALVLEEGKPPVLQGDAGLSQKGPEPGNASYYYSLTRMPTRGTVTVGGASFQVTGSSWMDREWSTSALSPGQQGWDWFSLQLSDGSELMVYQLRRDDGSVDRHGAGTWVPPAGSGAAPVHLRAEDVQLEVLAHWTSPRSGVRYPARWRLTVPSLGLALTAAPRLADQELPVSVRYWEGTVAVEGERGGAPLTGDGYVELTGYADGPGSRERQGAAKR